MEQSRTTSTEGEILFRPTERSAKPSMLMMSSSLVTLHTTTGT